MSLARRIDKPPANADVTSVAQSDTVVTLLASNAARVKAYIYNEGTRILYIKLGTGATTSDFTVGLFPQNAFRLDYPAYTGQITGIWAAAGGGAAKMTEVY